MLQFKLLQQALDEIGVPRNKTEITIDHINGTGFVNGVLVGLIYPKRFFYEAARIPDDKILEYYFNGAMPVGGGRQRMLAPYAARADSLVVASKQGRNNWSKGHFNKNYYEKFCQSRFGLCPHQADWPGPAETMWTYRFVESCIAKAIPILFRETPLGHDFIKGFHFFWDDQLPHEYNRDMAMANAKLAFERFTFDEQLRAEILASIQ